MQKNSHETWNAIDFSAHHQIFILHSTSAFVRVVYVLLNMPVQPDTLVECFTFRYPYELTTHELRTPLFQEQPLLAHDAVPFLPWNHKSCQTPWGHTKRHQHGNA